MKTKLFFIFSIFFTGSLVFFLYPYVDRYMDIQNHRTKIGDLINIKVEPRPLSCNMQAVNEAENKEFIGYSVPLLFGKVINDDFKDTMGQITFESGATLTLWRGFDLKGLLYYDKDQLGKKWLDGIFAENGEANTYTMHKKSINDNCAQTGLFSSDIDQVTCQVLLSFKSYFLGSKTQNGNKIIKAFDIKTEGFNIIEEIYKVASVVNFYKDGKEGFSAMIKGVKDQNLIDCFISNVRKKI